MTFFLFRRVAIGNRNSGIKQTFWSKVMKSWRKGFKALSLPTHSATKLMSNLPEKSWVSARSSSLSNWRVCWLWSFHRVSKVAVKGGHNLRPTHGERESTRKLGSKKLVHKIFLLRKWRENGVDCPPSKGSFEGSLASPELGVAVPDSLRKGGPQLGGITTTRSFAIPPSRRLKGTSQHACWGPPFLCPRLSN